MTKRNAKYYKNLSTCLNKPHGNMTKYKGVHNELSRPESIGTNN